MTNVDEPEPGPAVQRRKNAFVERLLALISPEIATGSAVHDVGDTDVARCGWSAPSASPTPGTDPLISIPIRDQTDTAEERRRVAEHRQGAADEEVHEDPAHVRRVADNHSTVARSATR